MMLRLPLAAVVLTLMVATTAAAQRSPVFVVPAPDSMRMGDGAFLLRDPVTIAADLDNVRLAEVAEFLATILRAQTGYAVAVGPAGGGSPSIVLEDRGGDRDAEDYELTVSPDEIRIAGTSARGAFWGIQTLRQLLPPAFEDPVNRQAEWPIPAVHVRDRPNFPWRGSLLDVSRHFFPVEFVERYIDLLSRYKMNTLHWHLTDDQGWRIEISRYPRLTEVGAWRTEPDGSRYGGFYTQEEIRRVVAYARQRNVTVVPEIEMPGHAQAAIASYPELGCTGDSVAVAASWGVMHEIYCPTEGTFTFLAEVLEEVLALFPSPYVHIGGDEVPKDRWRQCEDCQALMRREGLADEAALQRWFVERIERWLHERGRTLIGWDEILEGGLSTTAIVQAWRGMEYADSAARRGNRVIVSPTSHAYFDASPASLPLSRVLAFDPIPPGLDSSAANLILGGEANIWTEYITTANFDPMVFPRLLGMSQALWSGAPVDTASWLAQLRTREIPRLEVIGVRVGPEDRDLVRLTTTVDTSTLVVRVAVERGLDGIEVHYTTDGSSPTVESDVYDPEMPLDEPGTITMRPYLDGEPLPVTRTFGIAHHRARGQPISLTSAPRPQYRGTGSRTLIDGILASTDHHDGLWQGFLGQDLEATIDLGAPAALDSLTATFLHAPQSWILLPRSVAVWLSPDSVSWTPAGEVSYERSDRSGRDRQAFTLALPAGVGYRYVRVLARNPGPLPAWHAGAGRPSWIFADEIVVR